MAELVISTAIGIGVNLLVSLLTPKPTQKAQEPTLRLPGSEYGRKLPRLYGTGRFEINWIWPDSKEKAFKKRKKRRKTGKGGGSTIESIEVTGYFYGVFCHRKVSLQKLIVNGKVMSGGSASANWGNAFVTFFDGDPNQDRWSYAAAVDGTDNTPAYRSIAGIGFEALPLKDYGNSFPSTVSAIVTDAEFGENPSLAEIVKSLCLEGGMAESKIDVTDLESETVHGFYFGQGGDDPMSAIESLKGVFLFYSCSTLDGKLAFRKYRRPIVKATLSWDDLGVVEEGGDAVGAIERSCIDDLELPKKIFLKFYNPNLNYDKDSVVAEYQAANSDREETLDTEVIMGASAAKSQATKLLHQAWIQRDKFKFSLRPKWMDQLENGDVLILPTGDYIQIERISLGVNFMLQCEAFLYEPASYSYEATIDETERPISEWTDPTGGDAELFLLDTNLVEDTDEELGIYPFTNTPNSTLFVSRDGGGSWIEAYNFINDVTYGSCSTLGGGVSPWLIDRKNKLVVTVRDGQTLEGINDTAFLGLEQVAFVGRRISDRWEGEYIAYRDAVLTGPNTYELSTLLRGVRGTEGFIDLHTGGETFILLSGDGSTGDRMTSTINDLGVPMLFKLVRAPWEDFALLPEFPLTPQGKSLKPYAVAHLRAIKNGDDIVISWVGRERKFHAWRDGVDQVISDIPEIYELSIYNGNAIVRTVTLSSPTFTYTSAMQTDDFGSLQSSVKVSVVRISSVVGKGYEVVETLAIVGVT